MRDEEKLNPNASATRTLLRRVGPIIVAIGLMLMVIGIGSFFASFGSFELPRYFWCAFLGIPVLFVGFVMCQFGFLGSVLRYFFGETAPVQKDTFNYLAEGTRGGVRTMASAVGEGLAAGMGGVRKEAGRCPRCQQANAPAANFCSSCGAPLVEKVCPSCGALSGPEAKFCEKCAHQLG